MRKSIFFFLLFATATYVSEAQSKLDSLRNNKYYKMIAHPSRDPAYVSKFTQRFTVRPFFSYKVYKFIISDIWSFGNNINYYPNVNNRLGLGLRYKGLGLSFSFKMPANDYIYGKTKSFNLYLNTQMSFLNWGLDFYYVRNKGFYMENADELVSGWRTGTPYPTRPDLRITNAGLSTHMVFSRKFSLKAALYQTEKQKKSAGGISLGAAMAFTYLKADSSLIPPSQLRYYSDIDSLTSGGFLTIAAAPGYSYTYVLPYDLYITGMALVGLGFQFQGYRLVRNKISPGFKLTFYKSFRIAVGYNADKFFGSVVYHYTDNHAKVKDSKFTISYQGVSINVGMRID